MIAPVNTFIWANQRSVLCNLRYKSSEVQGITRSAGLRWHQGEIEKVYNGPNGIKLYQGRHTKGEKDGKRISYKVICKISNFIQEKNVVLQNE